MVRGREGKSDLSIHFLPIEMKNLTSHEIYIHVKLPIVFSQIVLYF